MVLPFKEHHYFYQFFVDYSRVNAVGVFKPGALK